MTCRTCGYEAPYELPSCPRCGAGASAVPAPPPSGSSAQPSTSSGYAAGPTSEPDEPLATERTINRAALRAELARGGMPPAGLGGGDFVVPTADASADLNGDWLGGAGVTAYPSADDITRSPELAVLAAFPDAGAAPPELGPSFAEGTAGVAPAPATLGARFLAQLLDSLVLTVVMVPFGLAITLMDTRRGVGQALSYVLALAFLAAVVAYATVPMGRHGRTIGKNAMRIEVQDVRTGEPIGVGRAFARHLVLGLMGSPCYLGYLSVFFDGTGYHRGWHDVAASSRVVKATTSIPVSTLLRLRG